MDSDDLNAKLRAHAEALHQTAKRQAEGPEGEDLIHELEVHQIELELQNEALRSAQTALEVSLARYRDLFDLAPVGYVTLLHNGSVVNVNLT